MDGQKVAWNYQWRGILYFLTHTFSDKQLRECSHINRSSPHPWDPMKVRFPKFSQSLEEAVGGMQYISDVVASYP